MTNMDVAYKARLTAVVADIFAKDDEPVREPTKKLCKDTGRGCQVTLPLEIGEEYYTFPKHKSAVQAADMVFKMVAKDQVQTEQLAFDCELYEPAEPFLVQCKEVNTQRAIVKIMQDESYKAHGSRKGVADAVQAGTGTSGPQPATGASEDVRTSDKELAYVEDSTARSGGKGDEELRSSLEELKLRSADVEAPKPATSPAGSPSRQNIASRMLEADLGGVGRNMHDGHPKSPDSANRGSPNVAQRRLPPGAVTDSPGGGIPHPGDTREDIPLEEHNRIVAEESPGTIYARLMPPAPRRTP